MSLQEILTLAVTLLTVLLLVRGRIRPDLVALIALLILGLSRITSPEQTLAGFSSSAVITILAISIMAEGLHQSGISYQLGQIMKRLAGNDEKRLVITVTLSGALLSLFMNNIAAISVLLPATMSLSRQTGKPPSRLLMPLAFGVLAGGMATLFTTSNIITSGLLKESGFRPFGILDFLPIGIPIVILTTLFMGYLGYKLLPSLNPSGQAKQSHLKREEILRVYGIDAALWEVVISHGSGMAGLSIKEGAWFTRTGLSVIGITRNGTFITSPGPEMQLKEGDVLLTHGNPENENLEYFGIKLNEKITRIREIHDVSTSLTEITLVPHSNFATKTLREIHFREKYNLTVLALWRSGKPIHANFTDIPLQVGDGLLVSGLTENLQMLDQDRDFIILEEDPDAIAHPQKRNLAAWIGLVTLGLAVTGWVPIALVSLLGAVMMLLFGCLNMDEATKSLDWKVIFLIAGLWPLSTAITSSGLSSLLVQPFLSISNQTNSLFLVSAIIFITMVLTNIMAGQAATPLIIAPIGLAIAKATGLDPRMIMMAIAMGCSLAFITPLGHPVNLIVMSSGGYTYRDFIKVGLQLTFLIFILILIGLNLLWIH